MAAFGDGRKMGGELRLAAELTAVPSGLHRRSNRLPTQSSEYRPAMVGAVGQIMRHSEARRKSATEADFPRIRDHFN